jgi:hypothetical protein
VPGVERSSALIETRRTAMIKNNKIVLAIGLLLDTVVISYNGVFLIATMVLFLSTWSYSNVQFFDYTKKIQNWGIDYVKYISQAQLACAEPTKIYDIEAQRTWMVDHVNPNGFKTQKDFDPFYFTPPNCVASMTFVPLPFAKGLIIWALLQLSLTVAVVTSLTRKTLAEWAYFWLVVLSGAGSRFNIIIGQTSFLMSGLIAGMYGAWLKDRQIIGGLLLAIAACFKPHHCLVPIIMILAKRQWKSLASLIVSGVVIGLLTAQVLGLPAVLNYPANLHDLEQKTYSGNYFSSLNTCINFRAILGYVMDGGQAKLCGSVILLAAMVFCYWIWRQSLLKGEKSYGLALLVTTAVGLACNLHAYFYDLTLLILPCALSLEAIGFYKCFEKINGRDRLFCISFPVFWTVSQIHHSLSQDSRNWHLLYLCVYAIWGFVFWHRIKSNSVQQDSPLNRL